MWYRSFFFFFQAEDGIRDYKVTGVQTCALPILLERRLAELGEGIEHIVGGLGEHRLDRAEQLDAIARETLGALGERDISHRPEVPRKHRGAAHEVRVEPRGAGHGFGDEPLERPLAQLTDHEPEEKLLLLRCRAREQLAQQLFFRLRGPLPRRLRQAFQCPVYFSELERTPGRRPGVSRALRPRSLESGVADADPPLSRGAREKRDRG